MKFLMFRNLADDDTTSAEGPAESCRSEIVNVDVSVVGMINGTPTMTIPRLPGNDRALVQSKPSNLF